MCPFALLSATAYGYKNGQWFNLGGKSATGQWVQFFDSGFCTIGVSWSQTNSQYSKIRIAAKAAAFVVFATQPRRVTGTVEISVVPR